MAVLCDRVRIFPARVGTPFSAEAQLHRYAYPDDFQRQLQALAAASGALPGTALITLDGFQSPSALPPKSAIQEVRIGPDIFSAEYEHPPYAGGRIEVFTKPGQDKFHGAVFGVLGSHIWNLNDPFSATGTPADKQRGLEFSGPLLSRKRADFALDLDHRSIDENAVLNAFALSSVGPAVPLNQTVATPQRLWLANARTGWQVGSKDTLTVSFAANDNSTVNKGVGGPVLLDAGYFARVSVRPSGDQHDLLVKGPASFTETRAELETCGADPQYSCRAALDCWRFHRRRLDGGSFA